MPVLAQQADGGDVRRGADRREVAAERRARQQTEVQQIRLDAETHGELRHDGQHRRNIGDVIDERGEQHTRPHNDCVDQEHIAAAELFEHLGNGVDHARLGDAADDHEKSGEQQQRLVIELPDRLCDPFDAFFLQEIRHEADEEH